MVKSIIGFGRCSKYYLYILGTAVFKCLRDCIFGFNNINPDSKIGLFGFTPQLSHHHLLQSLYRYASFILGGGLFIYILHRNIKADTVKENNKNKERLELKGLIHNNKSDGSENAKISEILKVCLIYGIHAELSRIMYLFDFYGLDFWTVDVFFILLFMHRNFIFNYYKHQKYSMALILISVTILLLISSFLPFTNHDDTNEKEIRDKNSYQIIKDLTKDLTGSNFFFILVILLFALLSCLISYQRVKEKVLMDFYYLSPYRLIFFIGISGFILTSIILTITSNFQCLDEKIYNYCSITRTNNNVTEYYYDNLVIYFEELKNNTDNYQFYLEIILIPPLYLIISFLEFTCEILTILNLNPNFVLIRDNIYYGTSRLLYFLFIINKNYQHYITLSQFIILEMTEIIALIGYAIYLEIIELRFWGFDKDLKRNIIKRGFRETPLKPMESLIEDKETINIDESLESEQINNNNVSESHDF